ncbi:MAG: DUF4956 domain-containing protein [Lachnospiraceae bacterium]|nr:DUF4956 domain-containing protein [Lachnospiraceae bacterium]
MLVNLLGSIFVGKGYTPESILSAMIMALFLGLVITLIYKTSGVYTGSFVVILAILPFLVQTIIMIVNGNLGTSVAELGAFGLVRFRSIPGSAREIGFIFYAMAIGLATGMGFLTLALVITAVAGVMILLLEKTSFSASANNERELRITIPEDLNYNGIFDDLFLEYTKHTQLDRVKTTNMGTMYELSYRTRLRDQNREKEFLDALRCRNGNLTIILGLVPREKNEL